VQAFRKYFEQIKNNPQNMYNASEIIIGDIEKKITGTL